VAGHAAAGAARSQAPRSGPQENTDNRWLRRRPADAHPDAPARRPILAHAELGAQG
jgi:hypothetical protein